MAYIVAEARNICNRPAVESGETHGKFPRGIRRRPAPSSQFPQETHPKFRISPHSFGGFSPLDKVIVYRYNEHRKTHGSRKKTGFPKRY